MAGSKCTQTRFVRHKHLLYIPLLAFLYYAPINVDVFVKYKCGKWETFRLFSGCHDGSWLSVLIQLHSDFCIPQKASVGIYSRCLCLTNLVCVLFDPAIPTSSFNFIVFILVSFFFIALSIIYQCHFIWLAH